MADPLQEDADRLVAFVTDVWCATIEPHIARRFVKDANGNLDRALANWEADPDRYAADKYDEDLFSQDRDGGSSQLAGVPSFQIDHADDNAGQYPRSTAATRPNTRPNTPSNSLHGSGMGDYHGPVVNQETGVVGGTGVQFGPATREHYESSQWALTTVSNTIPDLPPNQRTRNQDEPAFLKPLPSQDYLPALLTILERIPMARNALLLKNHVLPSYGQEPLWWSGTPIALPQTIIDGQEDSGTDGKLIHETQRLMAFLHATARAYGSAEALTKLEWFRHPAWLSEEKDAIRFLWSWMAAATRFEPADGLEGLFETTAHQVQSGNSSRPSFKCLTPVLDNGGSGACLSLYDVLDDTIWSNDPDGTKDVHASIDHIAEVLVLILKQPDVGANGLNMIIPPSWFADRYLTEHESKSKQMRKDRAEYRGRIAEIQQSIQKYARFSYQGKTGDALALLETAMSAFGAPSKEDVETDGDVDMGATDEVDSSQDDEVLGQLQSIYDNVKAKIEDLKKEEQLAQQSLEQLSGLLKEQSDASEFGPKAKYQLCGLSTDPSVLYVKQNYGKPTADQDQEVGQGSESCTDWWRIQCDSSGQISKSRIAQADALTAAAVESREVMLVYASEKALSEPLEDLPPALAAFVSADNALFGEELAGETEQPPPYEVEGGGAEADAGQGKTDTDTVMGEADAKGGSNTQHIEFAGN
ncbi:hypothetical protein IWX90DRAFT_431186 [Phyllosticta citrichinensis]|uniref:Ubiquitin interaction motif protein n=1 Tax=Phyllosticta citrichinensis TaxID=1130410 RepID=A0ABR1XWZ0_9PEZI